MRLLYRRQLMLGSHGCLAQRNQLRAVRRRGELLEQIEASKGGRPPINKETASPSLTRTQAATAGAHPLMTCL